MVENERVNVENKVPKCNLFFLPNVEDDELHQSLSVHEHRQRHRLPHRNLARHRRQKRPPNLPGARRRNHQRQNSPPLRATYRSHVRLQPTRSKIQRQQQPYNEILNPLYQPLRKRALRNRYSEHERAENRVDPNHVRHEPEHHHEQQSQAHVGFIHRAGHRRAFSGDESHRRFD